jgi:hypothetical protein
MMEVTQSSKMSVLTRATWHHITEDGILNMVGIRRFTTDILLVAAYGIVHCLAIEYAKLYKSKGTFVAVPDIDDAPESFDNNGH